MEAFVKELQVEQKIEIKNKMIIKKEKEAKLPEIENEERFIEYEKNEKNIKIEMQIPKRNVSKKWFSIVFI